MIPRLDYRGDLTDREALAECLARTELSSEACRVRAELFAEAAIALGQIAPGRRLAESSAFYVPGRIEVLGKHTDYAGGRTMVAAVERGFSVVLSPRDDRRVRVADAVRREVGEFDLDPELTPRAGHWLNYPMTVARRIARNFSCPLRGADVALASDLPPAAGMSSSSAMIVALFLALAEVNRLDRQPEYQAHLHRLTDLAGYLGTIENGQTFGTLAGDRGVGTFGGSEDHTAILNCLPGRISQYRYCPVRFERAIPVPPGHVFAIAVSGVVAEKTGTALEKYNAASRLVRQIMEVWRRETGRSETFLADALGSSPEAAGRLAQILGGARFENASPQALLARLEHFVTENEQIQPAAGDALQCGDLGTFGRLVDHSQLAAEEFLGNQVPETSYLAMSARAVGAVAASAFGAGFGGAVWALVETPRTAEFLEAWAGSYRTRFPQHAGSSQFFRTAAGPAAFRIA